MEAVNHRMSIAVLVLVCLLTSTTPAGAQAVATDRAQSLATTTLTIGTKQIVAEVASSPAQREIGLMHRFSLQPDHGMIFVFPSSQPLAFWMRNTFIPLSIATSTRTASS